MGSVFKKTFTKPVPADAEVVEKKGQRLARWRVKGKLHQAPITKGESGTDRLLIEGRTFYGKYRNHAGVVVVRPTGCKDEQAARQLLAKWEREAEQIKSGTLDAKHLNAARKGSAPLEEHLSAYERSLTAAEVSDVYRANVLRAVRRVAKDCGFATPAEFNREAIENWLADRMSNNEDMSARSRNYYRQSVVTFANWCVETGRLLAHDLDRVPKADEKVDPRRQRRALTEDELKRVLNVAATRPLADARTVRRGKRKGKAFAELRNETIARLHAVGRERALIYKTLVLTGLRANELRTLMVGQLDLTPGNAFLHLNAADEKSRQGNSIAIRDDLSADLRAWIADKLASSQDAAQAAGEPIPIRVPGNTQLFDVPAGLLKILDRDLKAAGIPKRDDRGRTVDVHAMRTTFGTMLSTTGTSPRTAQAAMRHSDIKLTMGVYTDPRLLDVRGAVERLPTLPLEQNKEQNANRATGTTASTGRHTTPLAPVLAPTPFNWGHFGSSGGTHGLSSEFKNTDRECCENAGNVNEKPSVTSAVTEGHSVGPAGFEPTTSCTPSKRASQAALRPETAKPTRNRLWSGRLPLPLHCYLTDSARGN